MGWFTKKKARPDAQDVANRALTLRYMATYSMLTPPPEVMAALIQRMPAEESEKLRLLGETNKKEFSRIIAPLRAAMSPREKKFFEATMMTMSAQEQTDAIWGLESAYMLLWALGQVPSILPYDTQATPEEKGFPDEGEMKDFVAKATLRAVEEIDEARSLAELWHWRSRTRQLMEEGYPFPKNPQMEAAGLRSFDDVVRMTSRSAEGDIPVVDEDFAVKGKAYRDLTAEEWQEAQSIAMERHRALNWVCGYAAPGHQWDDTPTET